MKLSLAAAFALLLLRSSHALAPTLRIGTRGSPLALAQAQAFAKSLQVETEICVIGAGGDVARSSTAGAPLAVQGVDFTGSLDEALQRGDVDVVVHSLKDVPPEWSSGMMIGCHLPREDPTDVLVSRSKDYTTLQDLPPNAKVGTSSIRRQAQLLSLRPDLQLINVRGNVNARLRLLLESSSFGDEDLDCLIMASAGLNRLGLHDLDGLYRCAVPATVMVPGCCQGIVGIACLDDDQELLELLHNVDNQDSRISAAAERAFLLALRNFAPTTFCSEPYKGRPPLASYMRRRGDGGDWEFTALLARPDGEQVVRASRRLSSCTEIRAMEIGKEVGEELRQQAGDNFYEDSS